MINIYLALFLFLRSIFLKELIYLLVILFSSHLLNMS